MKHSANHNIQFKTGCSHGNSNNLGTLTGTGSFCRGTVVVKLTAWWNIRCCNSTQMLQMFAIFKPHLGTVVNVNFIYISVIPACCLWTCWFQPSHQRICVSSPQAPQEMLTQSVLAEIPGQVTSFFNTMKLKPPHGDTPVSDPPASAPPSDLSSWTSLTLESVLSKLHPLGLWWIEYVNTNTKKPLRTASQRSLS